MVFNKYTNCIYFVSESFYDNARILKINLTNSNYFNNSELYTLNGINNIKDIKIDFLNNNFYLLTGQVSSNIYKLDMDFNIIPVSSECGIESLSLPSDWNSGQNMEIDYITGIIYVFFIFTPYNGFVTVNIKDMKLDTNFHQFQFNRNDQIWTPIYLNTTFINRKTGKIYVGNRACQDSFFFANAEISLYGCSEGRRFLNNKCVKCGPGFFSEYKGSQLCEKCDFGYSSSIYESSICNLCKKGKYSDKKGSISCKSCSPGNYSEIEGATNCLECEEGRFNINYNSNSPTDCILCTNGKFSTSGSSSCKTCELGKFTKR